MSAEARSGTRLFVGREGELAILAQALDDALAARGSLTAITGLPGIGKSALVDEHLKATHARAVLAVRGRCLESDASPYGLWLQVLSRLARAGYPTASPQLRRWLAATQGELTTERTRLFDLVASHLIEVARAKGLVLVLEDVQWADASSLLLLSQLLDDLTTSRLQVIATCDQEVDREDARPLIQRIMRDSSCRTIVLQYLPREEARRYLELRIARRLTSPDESAFLRLTGGHPLFMSEVAAVLASGGKLDQVPRSVQDMVRQRVSRLGADARKLVEAGAVIGSEVDLPLLSEVLGTPQHSLAQAVDEATAAALIAAAPDRPDRFRFVHEVFREAIYGELAPSRRREHHRRAAEALEALHGSQQQLSEHLAELSYHWLRSGTESSRAGRWTEAAADHAVETAAYEEGIRHYQRAVVIPGYGGAELRLKLARAQYLAGDIKPAFATVQKVVEEARAERRPQLMAEAVLVLEGVGDPELAGRLARTCEDVLEELAAGEPALRARVLGQLTTQLAYLDFGRTARTSADAIALAEESGDPEALVSALRARQMARCGADGVEERISLAQRMIELGSATRRPQVILWGRLWRIDALLQLGDFVGVDAEQAELARLVEQLHQPLARWHLTRIQAARAAFTGDFQRAQALAAEARELGRRGGHVAAEGQWAAFQVMLARQTGDHTFLEEAAPQWRPGFTLPVQKIGGAIAMLLEGRRPEARDLFEAAAAQFASHPIDHQWLGAAAGLADLCRAFSANEVAAALYPRLAPFASHLAVPGAGPPVLIGGAICLHLGRLAALLGEPEAGAHLRQAIELHERLGSRPFAALSKFEYARHLAASGSAREAHDLAQAALATAQQLEMRPLAAEAAELASVLTRKMTAGPLSRRETEIAELVARGLTNKQIAASFYLSERTVETHVQNILGKLGFRTRSQVAAWAAQRSEVD